MGRRTAGTALRILVAFSIGIRQNRSGKGERTENTRSISRPFGRRLLLPGDGGLVKPLARQSRSDGRAGALRGAIPRARGPRHITR